VWRFVVTAAISGVMLVASVLCTEDGLCHFPQSLHWIPIAVGQLLFAFMFSVCRELVLRAPRSKEDE